jgi:hypothetical protein
MKVAVATMFIAGLCGPGCFSFPEDGGSDSGDAGSDTTFDPAVCRGQIEAASDIDNRLADDYASPCSVDSDCAIDPGVVGCPDGGAWLDTSEIAYSIHRKGEYQAARAAAYQDFCIAGCGGFHLDNFYHYAYCRDGICRGTYREPDEYCPGALRRIADSAEGLEELGVETQCTDVSECRLVVTEIDCEASANRFVGCPIAVQEGQEQSLLTVLHDVMLSSYCSDSGFTCDEVAECPLVELACLAGVCTAVEVVLP